MKYYIYNFERNLFWKPGEQGYTDLKSEAGQYSGPHAVSICRRANMHCDNTTKIEEAMVPVEDTDLE